MKIRLAIGVMMSLAIAAAARSDEPKSGAAAMRPIKVGILPFTREQYKPVPGKPGGRIVVDTLGEPKSFNPVTASETSTTDFTRFMFMGLTDLDPFTGETIPMLAEKWEVAADGLTWTFHLRKDVQFNDGTPFTANDVVFTWNDLIYDLHRPAGATPRWPCSMRDITTFNGKPIHVEALDDYTVRFITPVKVAIMEELAGTNVLCKAKYEKFVANGTFASVMGTDSKPEDIVGTGPFMLGQYVRGEKVVLKKNPHFYKVDSAGVRMPYLDEMVFLLVRDLNVMLVNFQQKVTDVYPLNSGKEVPLLKPRQQEDNFTLYQLGPADGTYFVCFNMNADAAKAGKIPEYKLKWFTDPRFRQAVSCAIDRRALIRNVLRGLGYSLPGPFTLSIGPYRQEGFEPHPYDPEKAKSLLAEMGLKDRDGSGILSDEQGHKLQFTINTNSGNNIREEMCDFIRKDLHDIGMDVNTLFLEFNLLVEKLDRTYDWECMVMALTGGIEPHWGANVWRSSGRMHMWWPYQKTPATDWEKKIDDIFSQGIQEIDKAKRKALYRQWVQIVYDQQPYVYLTCSERVTALRNRFGNVFPPPLFGHILHNIEEIYVLDGK